jgi:S1-C subfamily serine protease
VLGSFTTIVVIYMVITAVMLNGLIVKQTLDHNQLNTKINKVELETDSKLSEMITSILSQETELQALGSQIGSIDKEFEELKLAASDDFSETIDIAIPTVLTIRTNAGQGTGFIIHEEGYLVTNAHVLTNAEKVYTVTYDQDTIEAQVVGFNTAFDVALLRIPGIYSYLELDDSDSIEVGQKVIAIGNPLGLQFSVSEGIISGTHRTGPNQINAYIQTDAALNPGNSGGPLINKEGKVVGINNFKIGSGESLGFALESNYIKKIVNDISLKAISKELL